MREKPKKFNRRLRLEEGRQEATALINQRRRETGQIWRQKNPKSSEEVLLEGEGYEIGGEKNVRDSCVTKLREEQVGTLDSKTKWT